MTYMRDEELCAGNLLDVYRDAFTKKFGSEPILDVAKATATMRWAVKNVGFKRSVELLTSYFYMEMEWKEHFAYPLDWWANNLNEVIAASATISLLPRPQWVVALSETGHPVCSYHQFEMRGQFNYKPVPWNEWVEQSVNQKLQHSIEDWEKAGSDPKKWIKNWQEWGFIPANYDTLIYGVLKAET